MAAAARHRHEPVAVTIPAVAQVVREGGLDVPAGVTFLVPARGDDARGPRHGGLRPGATAGVGRGERAGGESFLTVLRHRFTDPGVYFLDEPEAALSFRSCLGLISLLDVMRAEGSQVVCATHSPLLVSLPGATLLEVGERGCARRRTTS